LAFVAGQRAVYREQRAPSYQRYGADQIPRFLDEAGWPSRPPVLLHAEVAPGTC
jgi:hypothetical protein